MRRLFRFGFLAVLACSSTASTVIAVTLGGETDTITRSPAVSSYIIEAVDQQGNRQTLADGGWAPDSTVQLTDLDQTIVASIQLTAFEPNNSPVVWGATPFAELGVFDGLTVPLFVQRKGDTARMPETIDAGTTPLVVATGRALYAAGSDTNLLGYDMLFLDPLPPCTTPTTTKSFALVVSPTPNTDGEQAMAWRIGDDDASVFGLGQCTGDYGGSNLSLGDGGLLWSDFAGGRTVMDSTSTFASAYIVGPSRLNAQSGVIFKITPDDEASTLVDAVISSISVIPRRGAATTWTNGYGLFIYGGDASGSSFVATTIDSSGGVHNYQAFGDAGADTREGLAAIAIGDSKVLLTGDGQAPFVFDLSCEGCAPQTWDAAKTNVPLTSPSLFSLGNGAFLLVGDDSTGATQLFRFTQSGFVPKPLKIARQHAGAVQFATGQIVIIGGGSATPESYAD